MTSEHDRRWVVGVDLSLTSTAVSANHLDSSALHVKRIRSKGSKEDGLSDHIDRLNTLAVQVCSAVLSVKPALVFMEDMMFGTAKDTSAHRRSGLWWMVASMLYREGVPMVAVPPTSLKKWATGKGNASKDMVLAAGVRKWPDTVSQNDEADAAWLSDMAKHTALGDAVDTTKIKDEVLSKLREPTHPIPVWGRDAPGCEPVAATR